jgi:hypothetical protein
MFSGRTRGRGAATDAPLREFGAQQAPRARTQKNGTGRCPGFLRTREARIQSEKPHHLHEPTAKTPTEKRLQTPQATVAACTRRENLQKPNKSKFNNNGKNCPTKPQAGRYKNKFKGKHRITWLGH